MSEPKQWHVEGAVPSEVPVLRVRGRRVSPEHIGGTLTRAERPTRGELVELDDGRKLRVFGLSLTHEEIAEIRRRVTRVADRYELEADFLTGTTSHGTIGIEAALYNHKPGVHQYDRRVVNHGGWTDTWTTSNGIELDSARWLDAYLTEYTRNPRNPLDILGAIRHPWSRGSQ
jgi:hypothetical protein